MIPTTIPTTHQITAAREPRLLTSGFSSQPGFGLECYDYQKAGVIFMRHALHKFGAVLNADAMGLGKTAQSLKVFDSPEFSHVNRILIVQKSATTAQWITETRSWLLPESERYRICPIIGKSKLGIPPGFRIYIISMSSLDSNLRHLKSMNFDAVIVDECHSFKDIGSKRTKALMDLLSHGVPYRIFLSGTPIENSALEYYPILHMMRSDLFQTQERFARNYLTVDGKGQYSRFSGRGLDMFRAQTSEFIIRRELHDVIADLPEFRTDYITVTPSVTMQQVYNRELELMRVEVAHNRPDTTHMLSWLTHMRHISENAKIEAVEAFIEEWLQNVELERMIDPNYPNKLVIGLHHHDAMDWWAEKFADFGIVTLSGRQSALEKSEAIVEFRSNPEKHILLCSVLAGGTGINLQFANTILMTSRQWNSTSESQFFARIHRNGQKYPTRAVVLMVDKSVDLIFHTNFVEPKRRIFQESVTESGWDLAARPEAIRDLFYQTLDSRI